MKKKHRRKSDISFQFRAALACVLAAALVFSVLVIFTYDFWTVAATSVTLFLLTAAWAVAWAAGKTPAAWSWVMAAVLFPVAWGALQIIAGASVNRFQTALSIVPYAEAACAFWIATQACQSERVRNRFATGAAIFGPALALIAIVQAFTSPDRAYWFIPLRPEEQGMGPFQNADHYAAFMEVLIPVTAWEGMRIGRAMPLFGVGTLLMYASVIVTLSRGGTAIATAELLVLGVVWFVRRRSASMSRLALSGVIVLVLVVIAGWSAGIDAVLQRFSQKEQFEHRREFFLSSVDMARTRPWFGYGLGTWPTVYPRFARFDPGAFANHAHNEWVEWASEGGIPLLLAFLIIAIRGGWLAWKIPGALGIPAIFLHNAVDFNMREHPVLIVTMAIMGWAEAAVRPARKVEQKRVRADSESSGSATREGVEMAPIPTGTAQLSAATDAASPPQAGDSSPAA